MILCRSGDPLNEPEAQNRAKSPIVKDDFEKRNMAEKVTPLNY
jgi:hypothetical protein